MPSSPDKDIADFTAGRLRVRYIIALTLIATLTVISQWVVQLTIAAELHDSRVVNIAGRQRMLSQKIAKSCHYLLAAGTDEERAAHRSQIEAALSLWQRAHAGLQNGDDELGLPGRNSAQITALFQRLNPDYLAVVDATGAVLAARDGSDAQHQAVRRVSEREPAFLQGMEAIVFLYDSEAKDKVNFARRLELGLAALTLVVLVLEARLIFAPAVRRLRHDMRRQEQHETDLETLFAASPTAMFLIDEANLGIVRGNGKAETLMGCGAEGFVGRPIGEFVDEKYDANRAFLEKIRSGDSLNEYEILLIDAHRCTIEALASSCRVHYARKRHLVIGITNISEIKKAQQTLQYYATFDEMTGLVNRRTGLKMLGTEMDRARRDKNPLAVCFVDVDGLKATNDQFGHQEGDWVIRTIAGVLLASIRGGDVALRLGGDEFLLILHDCLEAQAQQLVERVEIRLQQFVAEEGRPYQASASFGVALYDPDRHANAETLVAEADGRMYSAKNAKRSGAPSPSST